MYEKDLALKIYPGRAASRLGFAVFISTVHGPGRRARLVRLPFRDVSVKAIDASATHVAGVSRLRARCALPCRPTRCRFRRQDGGALRLPKGR